MSSSEPKAHPIASLLRRFEVYEELLRRLIRRVDEGSILLDDPNESGVLPIQEEIREALRGRV